VEGEGGVQLANPMKQVESAAAFAALGVSIEAPAGAQNPQYFVIADELAEIRYTLDGKEFTYRASATEEEDISGVYEAFTEDVLLEEAWDYVLTVNTIENNGGTVGIWRHGEVSYSLYSPQVTVPEELSNYAAELCMATAPEGEAPGEELEEELLPEEEAPPEDE